MDLGKRLNALDERVFGKDRLARWMAKREGPTVQVHHQSVVMVFTWLIVGAAMMVVGGILEIWLNDGYGGRLASAVFSENWGVIGIPLTAGALGAMMMMDRVTRRGTTAVLVLVGAAGGALVAVLDGFWSVSAVGGAWMLAFVYLQMVLNRRAKALRAENPE